VPRFDLSLLTGLRVQAIMGFSQGAIVASMIAALVSARLPVVSSGNG